MSFDVLLLTRFRPPVDDYGFGSYQQLPTSGSTPAASRSQTPQPPHAGRDPPELGNFQQSNSLVDFDDDSKESFIPATRPIVAPLPPMLLSTLAELRSRFVTKRKTSSAASFSPPPRSHIGNRQLVLPSIPEETAVDVSNSNDSSAARRTDQFGIDSACLDSSCEVLQQQQHHRCCDAAGRSIDDGDDGANAPASVPDQSSSDIELGGCGSCGSGTASSDELSSSSSSSSRKSCNANNSSAANRNNSSATSFSRRDAVLARLSQAAASWTSRFRFAPQPPQVLDTESRVKPATFVPSSSFILQEPQQQQTPPVDDDGFQTVELFSVSDDIPGPNQRPQPNHQHQMPESRRHRVGPFNYVAGGSR
jgi:hypothetical protein